MQGARLGRPEEFLISMMPLSMSVQSQLRLLVLRYDTVTAACTTSF